MLITTHILNRIPYKSIASILYELWAERKLDLNYLKSWVCAIYVYEPAHQHGKLGLRDKKSIFIRYSVHLKGYMFIGEQVSESVTKFES